ncbi:uncharacterized protein DDB_G0288805 [Nasonia vitripennis]|uniref:Uncharacterized protein n=1 Tax=Nasonia vitripennis TaxID=7425 RepID=A0A7M7Q5A6_NASVI|nr:uncharacterized protein DDB_G0288805 [Nasonia vitripennis]
MSDLIDFESPNTNNGPLLASPLIPVPQNNAQVANGAGPHFSEADKRRSMENNPFDMVMKKITEYEKNREDPFERVCEKAMMGLGESKDDLVTKRNRRYSDILKMNKTVDETDINFDVCLSEEKDKMALEDNDISIITDLNNTNLIGDGVDGRRVVASWSCDNKMIPNVNIFSPPHPNPDLSILNTSAMDDSLLDHNVAKDYKSLQTDFSVRPRSMSQNVFLSPKKVSPVTKIRRSLSVNDGRKNSVFGEDTTLASAQSSMFEDPMNNAFRKTTLKSDASSNSSNLSTQYDSFISKQKLERLNSDSSVFSGLSNISVIPMDVENKIRSERFCSEGSAYSGISNISMIPANNTMSSYESSEYSNNTNNKAFLASRSQLDSTSSNATAKTPLKTSDKSDLIKKFFEIKTRMSISHVEQTKSDNDTNHTEDKDDILLKSTIDSKECSSGKDEKLIDVDNSSDSVFNDQTGINDLIVNEARALAETFEKMASIKVSKSSDEDELFFSKTQLNFDDLPQSDDEAVDNLIELPTSPQRDSSSPETNKPIKKEPESNQLSPKEKIKALESEFIEQKDPNKKAMAATLLLDLEKLIKEEHNPDACKVLTDLQKLLGVECDNNTEILQVCLQSTDNSPREELSKGNSDSIKNVPDSDCELTNSKEDKHDDSKNSSSNSTDISESKLRKNVKSENESQIVQTSSENKENSNEIPEDQQLAINLLRTLNKIVNEKNGDSAVDVLRSLGSVLNMATELRSINKVNQKFEIKKNDKIVQKQLNRSTNSTFRSPSPKTLNVKSQNKSFEALPQRRSMTSGLTPRSNNHLLEVPLAKDKRKSQLLNIKKRFPSDPGLVDPSEEKKNIKSPNKMEPPSSLETKKPSVEPLKTKFKKKTNSEVVNKKGPLKAVIPLGSMQKRASLAQRMSVHTGNVTPPKSSDSIPSLKIASSTPISNANHNKSNPTASSTPNLGGLKSYREKIQAQQNSKNLLHVAPQTLNSSSKEPMNRSKSNKRMEKTSPQKRPLTPRKSIDINGAEATKLPRFSPRPVRVRNYSMNDLKTAAKSPQTSIGVAKTSSEKKIQRHSTVLSPLKNCNKLAYKTKPMSLISRLGKPASIQTGPEKENYA